MILILLAACAGAEHRATSTTARAAAASTSGRTAPARDDPVGGVLAALTAASGPKDPSAADRVLNALPNAVEGAPLASRTTSEAVYGTGGHGTITVTPLAKAAGPEAKMPEFFERFASSSQIQRERHSSAVLVVGGRWRRGSELPIRSRAADGMAIMSLLLYPLARGVP